MLTLPTEPSLEILEPQTESIPIKTFSTIEMHVASTIMEDQNLGFGLPIEQEFSQYEVPPSLEESKLPEESQIPIFLKNQKNQNSQKPNKYLVLPLL